jgi:hypothetical protein
MVWWRLIDRQLVQFNVVAPDGTRFLVRAANNPALRPPGREFRRWPEPLVAGLFLVDNLRARGRTGCKVEIYRVPRRYGWQRLVYLETLTEASQAVMRAALIRDALTAGRSWEPDK